jgi:hypothetical protein
MPQSSSPPPFALLQPPQSSLNPPRALAGLLSTDVSPHGLVTGPAGRELGSPHRRSCRHPEGRDHDLGRHVPYHGWLLVSSHLYHYLLLTLPLPYSSFHGPKRQGEADVLLGLT